MTEETGANQVDVKDLEKQVLKTLRKIFDPEIPVNIYDIGLIYGLNVEPSGDVAITMTLTAPTCPVAGTLPPEVKEKVAQIPGVRDVTVDLTWEPPWTIDRMSRAAKLELGIDFDDTNSRVVRFEP